MIICPLCESIIIKKLLEIPLDRFDQSVLYNTVDIHSCINCGHVFNNIDFGEICGLIKYYDTEYRDFCTDASRKNNQYIYDTHIYKEEVIFNFLNIEDDSLDSFEYSHKIEHVVNPKTIFKQFSRILKENGKLHLSIPDASRYHEVKYFNFYYFSLREHIHHFDLDHILLLADEYHFKLVDIEKNVIDLVNKNMQIPNLNLVFEYRPNEIIRSMKNLFNLEDQIKKYINQQSINLEFYDEVTSKPIYIYGMSREFFYLYENSNLKDLNIIGFIDDTPIKQQKYTFKNNTIQSSEILKDTGEDTFCIITAVAHTELLMNRLKTINYKGRILPLC